MLVVFTLISAHQSIDVSFKYVTYAIDCNDFTQIKSIEKYRGGHLKLDSSHFNLSSEFQNSFLDNFYVTFL